MLARALRELKEAGVWLAGASQEADTDIFHADLCRPLAIVLGGEGKGLRRLTQEECDMPVQHPHGRHGGKPERFGGGGNLPVRSRAPAQRLNSAAESPSKLGRLE